MMRWRPWPPAVAKKFRVCLVVRGACGIEGAAAVAAEVGWKGPVRAGLGALRRAARRNCTRSEEVGEAGVVEWNEEFEGVCGLSGYKDGVFQAWEVVFLVFDGTNQGPKNKASVIGTASLNLAEFVSTAEEEVEINLPLLQTGVITESRPSLQLTLSLLELRTSRESPDILQKLPALSPLSDSLSSEKDEFSVLKAGLRKVQSFTEFVSIRKVKKPYRDDEGSEGRSSSRSNDAESTYPFDTDSLDNDPDEGELDDGKDDSIIRKSFSYGSLASANHVGGSFFSDMMIYGEYETWVYYSQRRSDVGCSCKEEMPPSLFEQYNIQTSKRSILPWKKRKSGSRSPKAKGEPLLKKAYAEEGGDDIDYDRRQLSSSDESLSAGRCDGTAGHLSASDFGDVDNFEVGSWETKELVSRDGCMKLSTQVFFASIDQRSERAAGESACTALVAVIADWLQANQDMMPIKSQFDTLIREGSLEWRKLCENHKYLERFPDKHFDLETVLESKIRPLSVLSDKSFIGFFHPEATDNNNGFDFLHGAMSFDNIWDEINQAGTQCPANECPQVYIMSWNDHFFVLKVEHDAYYIIDTLGERLHEGCDQAYILKFDENTSIQEVHSENKAAVSEAAKSGKQQARQEGRSAAEEELVCRGKESCKEYIKRFLAAIPIRELQADIKKGLRASTPVHHRLQIECHYTEKSKPISKVAFDNVAQDTVAEFVIPSATFTLTPMNIVTEFAIPAFTLTSAVKVV